MLAAWATVSSLFAADVRVMRTHFRQVIVSRVTAIRRLGGFVTSTSHNNSLCLCLSGSLGQNVCVHVLTCVYVYMLGGMSCAAFYLYLSRWVWADLGVVSSTILRTYVPRMCVCVCACVCHACMCVTILVGAQLTRMSLVALLCIISNISMSLLKCGLHLL